MRPGATALAGLLRRFGRGRDGGVAIIVAGSAFMIVVLAALAVDLGSIVLRAREIQGAADLAALSAARDIPRAQAAALATTRDNLGPDATVRTDVGVWVGDPTKTPEQRFSVTATKPNGARVEVTAPARLYFAAILGKSHIMITRKATAAIPGAEPSALFTIGSRLLSLDRGLVNALLTGLLGSNVSLSVMDYNRLVGADVNLLEFLDVLGVRLNLEAGDYDALLRHEVETGLLLKVLEVVASSDARSVLSQLTGLPLTAKVKVADLIGVEADASDGLRRGLDLDVGALDLLVATLETANQNRHLALDTTLNLGLADVTLMAAIGEKPNQSSWVTLSTKNGEVLKTAQTRIYARVNTKNFIPELLKLDLELIAEVASAEARITDIRCQGSPAVDVSAVPGLLRVSLGDVKNRQDLRDFKKKIVTERKHLATVLLIPVYVYANLESKDRTAQRLTFSKANIESRTYKKVRSKEIASSLLTSLTKELELDIGLLSLGWVVNLLTPLTSLLGWILDMILNPLLSLLGIGLGEADVGVLGVNCTGGVGGIPHLVG